MSVPIEKLKEHFNNKPVPEGVKCLAKERDKVNALIDAVEDENERLRQLVRMMWKPFCWAQSGYDVCLIDEQDKAIRDLVHELRIEVNA